ncbi:MAG: Cas10/Cmr2 second palm domain-containing protein [Acidobacteriota bacterium]
MSVQILLYGKLFGIEEFLLSDAALDTRVLCGRSHWVSLLSEVLPRALLAELGLARVLLGSSGGGQFLLVLPEEARATAVEFLAAANREIREMSGGLLKLVCAATENLGDWSVVRKRLNEDLDRKLKTHAGAASAPDAFVPFDAPARPATGEYFTELALKLWQAESIGWNPDAPARIVAGAGKHTWSLVPNRGTEDIPLARHAAPGEDGSEPADLATLASRAEGRHTWGVLRGDVDSFRIRLRRAQTIEEHVRLSVLYKQLFAGELEVLCSQPEFWRKVTVLYSAGDDFAVYGAWDALIPLAREMQRLFHRFTEENLKDFPGPEGKTMSASLALAPEPGAPLASIYAEAGARLEQAKDVDKDCISVMGRVLEWRHLADASELRDTLIRMVPELGSSGQFLSELTAFYHKGGQIWSRGAVERFDRPWRFQRRLNRVLAGAKDREFQKLRAHLANEMMGRGAAKVKLRPAGLVALEWARLSTEV